MRRRARRSRNVRPAPRFSSMRCSNTTSNLLFRLGPEQRVSIVGVLESVEGPIEGRLLARLGYGSGSLHLVLQAALEGLSFEPHQDGRSAPEVNAGRSVRLVFSQDTADIRWSAAGSRAILPFPAPPEERRGPPAQCHDHLGIGPTGSPSRRIRPSGHDPPMRSSPRPRRPAHRCCLRRETGRRGRSMSGGTYSL